MNDNNLIERPESMSSLAAVDALKLASITIVTSSLSTLTLPQFAQIILWVVQTGLSVAVLTKLMKKFQVKQPSLATRYGLLVCLFSSILTGVWAFVSYQYLFPSLQEQFYTTIDSLKPMLNGEQNEALFMMQDVFGKYYSITSFVKNLLFGMVAASIIGSIISAKSMGGENKTEEL